MDRTAFADRKDASVKFETSDYRVVVGQKTGAQVPQEQRKIYFVKHITDDVTAGEGNQLGFAIRLAIELQKNLDELMAEMAGQGRAN